MVALIAVFLVIEALRRVIGWLLVGIVLVFISYAYVAPYMVGMLQGSPTSTERLFNYLYFDSSGIIGLVGIAATLGFSFVLFGQVLLQLGGGDIMNKLAIFAFGRFRGGTAKASVVSSSLTGTITGGPVTNVLLTGNITIPLMKKNGYTATQAGAIESVASTGGQLVPPVMGVAAFVMAEYLGIPYSEVALAALIPALLYYYSLFVQVDLLSLRNNIRGMKRDLLPKLGELKNTWLILPAFCILIYLMFIKGYTAQVSGVLAALAAFVFLIWQATYRKKFWHHTKEIFIETGKTLITVSVVLAAAGIVVGVTGITGLGFNLSMTLASVGDYGLFWLLVLCALVSLILGMGMPSVAAYSMVALLAAPALVEHGVPPIAAHLFVFYYAILCNFTPPIAMACFAASPIAQASPNKIGFTALKLGVSGFLVPFAFIYEPRLLLTFNYEHSIGTFIFLLVSMLIAFYFLSLGFVGQILPHQKLSVLIRAVFIVLSLVIFTPISVLGGAWVINSVAVLIGAILIIGYVLKHKSVIKEDASVSA
ncbi:TRAP transporter permease [Aliibacillus thermotolerans]|uniref:TRAP transporter permease n=1 Tax=Aliibacillus thermotolerans TaxID=1834418 RepID=A0ABW0U4U7_9BACI|nr:TRAP transporter fused permease subunit [Aliibacillus thermotolerans]